MADLAVLYPTSVFMAMFGLPLSDRDLLRGWVSTMVEQAHRPGEEAREQSERASWAIYDYMKRFTDEKRAHPGDDVLSRILALEGDEAWPLEDLIGICISLTMAGLDTVTAAIGWTFLYLARDPDLRHRVIAEPDATSAFIEELLRLEPPAPLVVRLATQDVEVCGVAIPAGSIVMLNVATANRGPRRYPAPDVLDLEQVELGHLTFGGGIHRCLGSHLARRGLRLVLEEFHRLIPDYALAPDFEPRVEWPSGTLHLESSRSSPRRSRPEAEAESSAAASPRCRSVSPSSGVSGRGPEPALVRGGSRWWPVAASSRDSLSTVGSSHRGAARRPMEEILGTYGWDDHWSALFARFADGDVQPGRIVRHDRASPLVVTSLGLVHLPARRNVGALTVGDWVVVETAR